MAEIDGGQLAARQLAAGGIDTLFGVVAGPMIEVFAGAQEQGMRVVGCRHEMNAGFMASAWGYQKRKPGVLVVGSGPGMTNAVTPMYVATASAMPLVVLGGSALSSRRGIGDFQEADQVAFATPACKWTAQVDSIRRIPELLHLALGKAVAGRPGAVYLDFPGEIVAERIAESQAELRHAAAPIARPHPEPDSIDRIAELLAQAERPLLMIGKGAAWADAGPALQRLADLGIPYVCSPMARGTIPDDHPQFANAARSTALAGADVIVMFGGRFNWIFGFGRPRRFRDDVKIAQIDIEAEELTSAARIEVGLVADAAIAAEQIASALEGRSLRVSQSDWLETLQNQREKNTAKLRAAVDSDAVPLNPYRLVREIRDAAPRDATISVDGETIMGVCRAILPSFTSRGRLNAGTTGCMGTGAPYAVGASLARPDRASIAVLGDYAFGAAAMSIETAARIGAPVLFVVANNEGIAGHDIQDQMLPPGAPPIAALLPARYEKMAEMVDGHAEYVTQPEQIRPALERALAAERVALVHVRLDPKASRLSGSNYLQ